jgi:hypothetical protein
LLRVTSELIFPFKEDLVRFDFDVDEEDDYMCSFLKDKIGVTEAPIQS